jgi:hypothetical protein
MAAPDYAGIAQLEERLLCNEVVGDSNSPACSWEMDDGLGFIPFPLPSS